MTRNIRIIVSDKSELSENLYKLLFAGRGADITVKKRFEEARPHFFRRSAPDIAIINTNCLGKRTHDILSQMTTSPEIARVKKIFLVKEFSTAEIVEAIRAVPNATLVERPFHPDEFLKLVLEISDEEK